LVAQVGDGQEEYVTINLIDISYSASKPSHLVVWYSTIKIFTKALREPYRGLREQVRV